MSDYLIVVVNRSLARFFALEPVEFPQLESGPRMKLRFELKNADIEDAREIFTDSKTGRGATPQGGGVHGYDDKRSHHLDELRRRFAAKVLAHVRKLAESENARTVVMAASARMRRFLFSDISNLPRPGYRLHKVSKNMINFSPQKIHSYLATDGLIPKQHRS